MDEVFTLYDKAQAAGYSSNLCLALHAKEIEDAYFGTRAVVKLPCVLIQTLEVGINRKLSEDQLLQISMGGISGFEPCDVILPGYEAPFDFEIASLTKEGEKTYRKFLSDDGNFNYMQYFKHLKKVRKGQLAKLLASTAHQLP